MDKFKIHEGISVPLLRDNVDTDAIIPSREMRSVSKTGLSDGLFASWRYENEAERTPNPEFVLNQDKYQGASILFSGDNFGCGSSREHAVWALKEYGIRCIIAQSFGAIFYRNCVANGILPIQLPAAQTTQLSKELTLLIDLGQQTICSPSKTVSFEIGINEKNVLLNGLDPIAETMHMKELIGEFRRADTVKRSWIYVKQ